MSSSFLALPIISGDIMFTARQLSSSGFHSSAGFKWDLQSERKKGQFPRRTRNQAINVLANTNEPLENRKFRKEVVMVDPLEAKKLAAKQMVKIKAKEKFQKRRQIEAINGAWAMIGLTAGLVIEGHTGNSFLAQLAGYWAAFVGFFVR